jgi:hypothetical protein
LLLSSEPSEPARQFRRFGRRSGIGSHPPRCHGPHFASLAAASQLPRIKPYSVSASTAYWLHVGTKRHDAGRSGETMCRYSWITKTSPRTQRADRLTAVFPPVQKRVATRFAAAALATPTIRGDCSAVPGSLPDRTHEDRPTWCERHAAAGAQPDAVPRPNPQTWR